MNYYNENDTDAANWLQGLIDENEIPYGVVDRRSIVDVQPGDLNGFTQHHFFAGIGGWSLGLRIAGWPDEEPVCTASCPCQPWSQTGLGLGYDDPRHLWPQFRRINKVRRFPTVIGEQVAGEDGAIWFSGIRADLEEDGYAVGGSDLPAASVEAPQRRQRLYWVGHSDDARLQGWRLRRNGLSERPPWATSVGVLGSDQNRRRIEPGIPPVAYGVSSRMALIRGSGNAIVPFLAAQFIISSEEARTGLSYERSRN